MKTLIVVCNFDKNSFNHAIANVIKEEYLKKGHEVIYHDLYEDNFSPVLTKGEYEEMEINSIQDSYIVKCCKELQEADIIAIIHPNWWGQPPALLKGWIDRVFRRGVAYKYSPEGKSIGLLKAETAYIINTSNTPEEVEKQIYGDPLENLWDTCIFKICGVKSVHRMPIRGIVKSDNSIREKWLTDVKEFIN
ncbi:NAD(P)H-dependent oxidoreductase [Anaerosacchariphilus polymeriproducens]|uniref:NAD(P)H-dependent oxidoreductase n=1 Tax=Anaerosacchariphilus polymeriproducens TaxID=1812858 RepID=UPI00138FD54D|nr:NAD(P)H-dependent oxidoreductase [Anaerosacchariphilus polymeriproducens]